MRTAISIIIIALLYSGCSVQKGSNNSQSNTIEKQLAGDWIVTNVTIPSILKTAPKENGQKNIEDMVEEIKNKVLLSFKSDHTFSLVMGQEKIIQSGTWEQKNNGEITTTDNNGKSGTFSSDALSKGKIDISFQMGSADKTGTIILHLKKR